MKIGDFHSALSYSDILAGLLFLLAANHGQRLFAQGMRAAGANVKALGFAVAQVFGGEVEIANAAAPALLLAGQMAIVLEQFVERGEQRLKVEATRVTPTRVHCWQRAGAIKCMGTLAASLAFPTMTRCIVVARRTLCIVIAQGKASAC